jgi:Zn-dependent peptidase ImmA (M78 family)
MLRPVIVVIAGAPGDRLRFNLAHELGHLVMHQTIRDDLSELEREANLFAAELLMPESALRQEIVPPVTLPTLSALKLRWRVSVQALIRRAYDLEIITVRQYKYLMHQLTERGWRLQEPINLAVPIEKPRALRQIAEIVYGNPINYSKLAADLKLPVKLVSETLGVHAGKILSSGSADQDKENDSKIINFDRTRTT